MVWQVVPKEHKLHLKRATHMHYWSYVILYDANKLMLCYAMLLF